MIANAHMPKRVKNETQLLALFLFTNLPDYTTFHNKFFYKHKKP